jgi:hypothetical protein
VGMDVQVTNTQHFLSLLERPYILATQNLPPRWNFPFGASLFALFFLFHSCTNERKVVAPKVLHGLLASGTDIWARELSLKTLGLRHVPATVCVLHLRFPMSDIERLQVLSLLDILLSRFITISLNLQLLGNDPHDNRFVLLPLGHLCSPL